MPLDATSWDTFAADHTGFFYYLNDRVTHRSTSPAASLFWFPTEAQWECACRAGTTTKYFWGSDANEAIEYGSYAKEVPNHIHEVGWRKPNPWGFYDMVGNAWQFCADYHGNYDAGVGYDPATHSVTDPKGPATGSNRVKRGSDYSSANRTYESSGYRGYAPPNWTQGGVRLKAEIL